LKENSIQKLITQVTLNNIPLEILKPELVATVLQISGPGLIKHLLPVVPLLHALEKKHVALVVARIVQAQHTVGSFAHRSFRACSRV